VTGSNNNGPKRRFASRHFRNAECFRIPKNPKIFVSPAIENAFFTKRIGEQPVKLYFNKKIAVILELVPPHPEIASGTEVTSQ
jgi:hypothetical protein